MGVFVYTQRETHTQRHTDTDTDTDTHTHTHYQMNYYTNTVPNLPLTQYVIYYIPPLPAFS